jgi:GAF domain-containing protein
LDEEKKMRFWAWPGLSAQYRQAMEDYVPWSLEGEAEIEPIFIHDITAEERLESIYNTLRQEGIQAVGFLPIRHHGKLIGQLVVCYHEPHTFAEEEIKLLQMAANNIAFAIQQAIQQSSNIRANEP